MSIRKLALKLSTRDRILLSILALAVLFGGLWWFYVKPARAELSAQRTTLEGVRVQIASTEDILARVRADYEKESKLTAQRLRNAAALPDALGAAGTIVQLERLASRANVELQSIETTAATAYGGVTSHGYQVTVDGRFFDVDDFLYRMHRQVAVDEKGRPIVGGRLFAITGIAMTPVEENDEVGGENQVKAVLQVLAFTTSDAPAAAPDSTTGGAAATQPVSTSTATTPAATGSTP